MLMVQLQTQRLITSVPKGDLHSHYEIDWFLSSRSNPFVRVRGGALASRVLD